MGRSTGIATVFVAATLAACGSGDDTSTVDPKPLRRPVATCNTAGSGQPPADWRRRDGTSTGPFGLFGPGIDFQDQRVIVELDNGQFGVKLPAVVEGSASVVVTVPTELRDDVGIDFGDLNTAQSVGMANQEVTFKPCKGRARTGWPGGLVVTSQKPIELLVQVDGEQRIRTLSVGAPLLGTYISTADVQEAKGVVGFSSPVVVTIEDDRIRWYSGCNTYIGDLSITDDQLMVNVRGPAPEGCLRSPSEQENDLLAFFDSNPTWDLDGLNRLTLSNDDVTVALQRDGDPPGYIQKGS